jgi:hypothetical protein
MDAALILLSVIVGAFCLVVVVVAAFTLDADGPALASGADEEPDAATAVPEADIGSQATPGITAQPTADTTVPLLPRVSYDPPAGVILADAKRLGGVVAQALTTYEADMSLEDVLNRFAVDPERYVALSEEADIVHYPGMWSRGRVEYAQLGGHLNNRASIMVVLRQELGIEELERVETRTMDVRLVRSPQGSWVFDRLASAGGVPVGRPATLSALAAAVVDDPRIRLPDSAIWDIYSGDTDEALLRLMADLADRTPYAATVLHTGHPHNVFETDRVSNHSVGRAIDVYLVGEALVDDDRADDGTTRAHVEWLGDRTDIKELGSPWKLPDATAHTFTNEVHQDHIHIGVY